MLMFKETRPEFQCLKGKGETSKVCNNKVRISKFEMIRCNFQCL